MQEWKLTKMRAVVALSGMLGLVIGCQQQGETKSSPVETPAESTGKVGHDDHDHADGGHHHKEHGPHGGYVVDLGKGKYHAEVIHDEESETITVYLLDSSAKKRVSIDAKTLLVNVTGAGEPQQYELAALSEEGQSEDGNSCYRLTDEALFSALHGDHVIARLTVT
ncbi:MAG: hypothetical protein O2955_18695, partial [Planctomycetota bacterium]|nr:hypothetical protein [Planctomycetota bacterium]